MSPRLLLFLILLLAGGAGAWIRASLPPRLAIALASRGAAPDAVLVPPAAVAALGTPSSPAAEPSRAVVWVVEKETARRREVEIGARMPQAIEIRRGLAADEAVILDPPADLRDGQPIRLRP
jgi:hypothetical protein